MTLYFRIFELTPTVKTKDVNSFKKNSGLTVEILRPKVFQRKYQMKGVVKIVQDITRVQNYKGYKEKNELVQSLKMLFQK